MLNERQAQKIMRDNHQNELRSAIYSLRDSIDRLAGPLVVIAVTLILILVAVLLKH